MFRIEKAGEDGWKWLRVAQAGQYLRTSNQLHGEDLDVLAMAVRNKEPKAYRSS